MTMVMKHGMLDGEHMDGSLNHRRGKGSAREQEEAVAAFTKEVREAMRQRQLRKNLGRELHRCQQSQQHTEWPEIG